MRMKLSSIRAMSCLVIIMVVFPGCSVLQKLGGPGSSDELANYALASNGATVSVSNYTPEHSPLTAINGITSSEGWDDGEGWECRFDRRRPREGGWSRLDPRNIMDYGSAWLEVQFSGPKIINRVTVYTLDSSKYPAAKYGIRDAWLQLWKEYGWTNVGEVKDGDIVSRVNLDREPVSGKIVFKFDPTKTDKVRLVVFQSNDMEVMGGTWRDETKTEKSVARVVEIQATGLEKISKDEEITADAEPAPEFVLQDLNGEWVRLSNFRGNVVIVTFWASWSSESKRQVRELASLNNQYREQNVVVIGISVDEGGAERIRPFVESSSLGYTILIADTSAKTAYGGVGKLPSTFVIDEEGSIYKEYFGYQGKHILELDIERLLPTEP